MAAGAFAKFWHTDLTRDACLEHLNRQDLGQLRLVSHDFANDVAPILFRHIGVFFNTNTFSRHARLIALERIGHLTRSFQFTLAHDATTFLPPLIAPDTLEELKFVYEPHTGTSRPVSSSSSCSSPPSPSRYGSCDVEDLLIKHYPPIFHAATNIPAFCRALRALPNLRTISISCPGQESAHRYRRDAVDYALVSLRVAIEQANPAALETLTLEPVHPGAAFSLRPQASFGSSPASTRIWRRVKKIRIGMDSFEFDRNAPADHLKILHTYLEAFPLVEEIDFEWLGQRGPCPLSLDAEPCIRRPLSLDSLNAGSETTVHQSCKPLRFRKLRRMHVQNATLDASQAAAFVKTHRKVLHEFNFDDCHLRSGTWDDALAPLSRMNRSTTQSKPVHVEVVEVPLMLSPVQEKAEVECILTNMWTDPQTRSRGHQTLRKIGLRTRAMVPVHVKRLLKTARLGFHI